MASTETRSGFRLPWVSEAHHPEEPAPETDSTDAPEAEATDPVAVETATASIAASTGVEAPPPTPTIATSPMPGSPSSAGPRRPTKFLADLARAMRAAAETERQEILERFQADAKSFIETIHQRSAVEATELRGAADADIAGVRDWSKAEISRIREETERRIAGRKAQLESEVEAQAGRIERQIERVHTTIGEFESEMSRFFESLLAEEDPTAFAALASNLPEPPSLEGIAAAASDEPFDPPAPAPEALTEPEAPAEPPLVEAAGSSADHEPATDEPKAMTEVAEADASAAAAAELIEVEPVEGAAGETAPPEVGETAEGTHEASTTEVRPVASDAHAWPAGDDELPFDPRVTALGLTPDFDAAEAEAAAAVAAELPDDGSGEDVPTIDDETIASRLAGLVPPAAAAGEAVETRVMVSGLVSVASIAGFKRGLARVEGVHGVSVSSGPDGEFVFAVTHAAGVDLAAAVATMQGFAARVAGSSEGRVDVVAHDPDAA